MRRFIISVIFFTVLNYSCSDNKQVDLKDEIVKGVLNKAFINFRFPLKIPGKRFLFYECNIHNDTKDTVSFELPYDIDDIDRKYKIYGILNEKDSINLYCQLQGDTNFTILPGQTREINFSLDSSEDIFTRSKTSNEYHLFLDSLAFITEKIIFLSKDSVFTFHRSKDYVMEHRFYEYYEEGYGFKN